MKTSEDLDAWCCGGWGLFIALNHQQAVGEGCCRGAHRTVRCATGQSGAPPDSPVRHRTGTVGCSVRHHVRTGRSGLPEISGRVFWVFLFRVSNSRTRTRTQTFGYPQFRVPAISGLGLGKIRVPVPFAGIDMGCCLLEPQDMNGDRTGSLHLSSACPALLCTSLLLGTCSQMLQEQGNIENVNRLSPSSYEALFSLGYNDFQTKVTKGEPL
jgi:hypothetical protein